MGFGNDAHQIYNVHYVIYIGLPDPDNFSSTVNCEFCETKFRTAVLAAPTFPPSLYCERESRAPGGGVFGTWRLGRVTMGQSKTIDGAAR